ncbi:hypothetical protein [Bdellovibrio sp. HCB-110]|uniref:hypothetical protein n=1 Tax=Bdellovibrio sp. HCB-110 TaxID=3391182 RepID=UPI0039B53099
MFKRQPTDTQFLFITLVLVLLMGIPTFHTLTANEELSEEQVVSATTPVGQRKPASVVAASALPIAPAISHFTQYDVSCAKKVLPKLDVAGSYVQFQGKNCLKNFKEGDIEIVNRSNGYTASVFISGSDKYQTDLIQLQKGDNEIAIRYRERSGKAVEEVVRVRSSQI